MRTTIGAKRIAWKAVNVLLISLLAGATVIPHAFAAGSEEKELREEANRLTYEILDLRARKKLVEEEGAALQRELEELDLRIAAVQEELEKLQDELAGRQRIYNASLRSLYMRGEVCELEVLLEARQLDELWQDTAYFNRIGGAHREALERLKEKIVERGLADRELREMRAKRERIAASLDAQGIDSRIASLQSRLDEINARLRKLASNRETKSGNPSPASPPSWSVPPPGKLLDRVPNMPPLSDFERTGILFSGYTTSYGEEFHGSPTASGVIFNMYDYTCAHRTLPFGTWLLVNFKGRQVIVQVNDRGPFVPGRVLDLSLGAAQHIGLEGVQWTNFEVIVPRGG